MTVASRRRVRIYKHTTDQRAAHVAWPVRIVRLIGVKPLPSRAAAGRSHVGLARHSSLVQAGHFILQPVSATGSAASTPFTSSSTTKRSSGSSVPFSCGVADIERRHELVVAFAVERVVRHQRDFGRQLPVLQELGHLLRIERFRAVGGMRTGPGRNVAEPVPRRRHLAAVPLADVGDELLHMRDVGLLPVPFEHPGADPRLRRQTVEDLQLLLRAGDVDTSCRGRTAPPASAH